LHYPADSKGSKESILSAFTDIIVDLICRIEDSNKNIIGIGFAFPGPFDYKKGICLIQGLGGKYADLYGINIKDELYMRIKKTEISKFFSNNYPIEFENDAWLFALGGVRCNNDKNYDRVVAITLGTGCGSCFIREGRIIMGEYPIPDTGMINELPFRESIVDDYLSVRGLKRISDKYFAKDLSGKELFERATRGDDTAIDVFVEFGESVGSALVELIRGFDAEAVIFGGQISKSYEFFREGLEKNFDDGIEIIVAKDSSMYAMIGAYVMLREKEQMEATQKDFLR
jgi:glucokinase